MVLMTPYEQGRQGMKEDILKLIEKYRLQYNIDTGLVEIIKS